MLQHGQLPLQPAAAAADYLLRLALEPYTWQAVAALLLAFVTWLAIIARIDLSQAHPATAGSYVTVTLASAYFLHEDISLVKLAGIALIMLGVYLIAD